MYNYHEKNNRFSAVCPPFLLIATLTWPVNWMKKINEAFWLT